MQYFLDWDLISNLVVKDFTKIVLGIIFGHTEMKWFYREAHHSSKKNLDLEKYPIEIG